MNKEIKLILVKFMIITALTLLYVAVAFYVIAPAITHIVFGDDMWKQFINKTSPYCCFFLGQAYGQFGPADQFNNPAQFGNNQFDNNQQFGNDQQYNQGFNNQFQQPYQSFQQPYGTPTYGPQMQPQYVPQGYGGFGIQEIITALIAGGGSAIYTKRRTGQLHDDNQLMMSEILKGKQVDAELARITYNMNKQEAEKINDAPTVKLENLQNDVNQFTEKAAKA